VSHEPTDPNCLNCATALQGPYCHTCGQKASSTHLSVHNVAHDAVHEFVHLDGKILTTMKLLVAKPGELTCEFIAGRRARYITPIRLYLTWSLIFFALATLVPAVRQNIVRTNVQKDLNAEEERLADEIGDTIMHNLPRVMFVLMPAFGALTWLFFRRQQRYYVAHLYYSIHFHTFIFFAMTFVALLGALGAWGKTVGSVLFLATFPYHYLALRRVFGGRVFLKGTAIGVLYLFVVAGALVVLMLAIQRQ
jgi:hypothetical protein